MKRLRIAFLTPEFVSECNVGGGLGNYLNKMTSALLRAGHEPEVFVLSHGGPATIEFQGIKVHRVHPRAGAGLLKYADWIPRRPGFGTVRQIAQILAGAAQLAEAFAARDREAPFDAVQSSDFQAAGLRLKARPGCIHLVRSSSLSEAYAMADAKRRQLFPNWYTRYELAAVRRANVAYSPSECGAKYYQDRLGRTVHICRPPALLETIPDDQPMDGLPARFLLHFGQLRRRKGTEWLAKALPLAWEKAPDLKLVLAGSFEGISYPQWRAPFGKYQENVIYLGQLTKPKLYAVLRRTMATVMPSLVDNLPNGAIESLTLGVPVIGTRGASIDELVEDGRTGELITMNDAPALAEAMVRVWRGESKARAGFIWDSPIARQMAPEAAVEAFLRLAGLSKNSPADIGDAKPSVPGVEGDPAHIAPSFR